MSPSGEEITLPVQWCEVKDPSETPNNVPTCGVPEYAVPSSGSDTLIELELDDDDELALADADADSVAVAVAAAVAVALADVVDRDSLEAVIFEWLTTRT